MEMELGHPRLFRGQAEMLSARARRLGDLLSDGDEVESASPRLQKIDNGKSLLRMWRRVDPYAFGVRKRNIFGILGRKKRYSTLDA